MLPIMRGWMSLKKTFVVFLSVLIQQTITNNSSQDDFNAVKMLGTNQQLVQRINDFASTIENKTQGLFDIDTELDTTKQVIFDDGRKNTYMIQKEMEKLSIIPMNPVKINQESYNQENFEEDKLYVPDSSKNDNDNDYYYYDADDDEDQQNFEEPIQVI